MNPRPPPLLYADSERSSDSLYFGRVSVPDPFVAFGLRGRRYAIVSALEFARIRKQSAFHKVLSLESCLERARKAWPGRAVGTAEVIRLIAREFRQRAFTVPEDFPAGLYVRLRKYGLGLQIAKGALFPEREIKGPDEAAAIREGNRCSAAGIAAAERMLRRSRVRAGRLYSGGSVLTSERLQAEIEMACLAQGAASLETIAAGGDQACDPHQRGSGPLRPNELIICDVFPRVSATGYYGDMTRTFLRGRASDRQRELVAAVRAAQRAALGKIRAGVEGRIVHLKVTEVFESRGFKTEIGARGSTGFFHGTGHGVGLAIHEPPRINKTANIILKRGSVVTVEPGLYYPGLGGCRIEDVVQVTSGAPKLLSSYPYDWELR
jgi:Xaa-Pro aminopeptidase